MSLKEKEKLKSKAFNAYRESLNLTSTSSAEDENKDGESKAVSNKSNSFNYAIKKSKLNRFNNVDREELPALKNKTHHLDLIEICRIPQQRREKVSGEKRVHKFIENSSDEEGSSDSSNLFIGWVARPRHLPKKNIFLRLISSIHRGFKNYVIGPMRAAFRSAKISSVPATLLPQSYKYEKLPEESKILETNNHLEKLNEAKNRLRKTEEKVNLSEQIVSKSVKEGHRRRPSYSSKAESHDEATPIKTNKISRCYTEVDNGNLVISKSYKRRIKSSPSQLNDIIYL